MTTAVKGRPRDPRVDQEVTRHLVRLLAERGPHGFSVDDLAAAAGVSKATLYRRYRSREEMIAAGFEAVNDSMPDVSHLSLREALVGFLTWLSEAQGSGMTAAWLSGIPSMPRLAEVYRCQVIEPRRRVLLDILSRGVERGEVRPDLPLDAAATMLAAPVVQAAMHRARGCQYSLSVPDLVECAVRGLAGGTGMGATARATDS